MCFLTDQITGLHHYIKLLEALRTIVALRQNNAPKVLYDMGGSWYAYGATVGIQALFHPK